MRRAQWLAAVEERVRPDRGGAIKSYYRRQAEQEYETTSVIGYVPRRPPSFFKGKKYLDYAMEDVKIMGGGQGGGFRAVSDPDAESGSCVRIECEDTLLMVAEQYVEDRGATAGRGLFRADAVKGPGYHWYKMGEIIPQKNGVYTHP